MSRGVLSGLLHDLSSLLKPLHLLLGRLQVCLLYRIEALLPLFVFFCFFPVSVF